MTFRLLARAAAASVLLTWAWAAPAAAVGGTSVVVGFPDTVHNAQRFTVSITSDNPPEVDYITYREVSTTHPPSTANACAKTMATNVDARFFGPKTNHALLKSSLVVKLRPYAVCWYDAPGGSLDPAKAVLASSSVVGTYVTGAAPSPTRATTISLKAKHVATREVLSGRTTGPATATVVIQVRTGASYRVIASIPATHNAFSGAIPAVAGQHLRAYLLPSLGWKASATPLVVAG